MESITISLYLSEIIYLFFLFVHKNQGRMFFKKLWSRPTPKILHGSITDGLAPMFYVMSKKNLHMPKLEACVKLKPPKNSRLRGCLI